MDISQESVSLTAIIGSFKDVFNGVFLFILGAAVLFTIINAGYMWMIGSENPQQVAKAKSAITWAIIGLALAGIAVALVNLVPNLLGIDGGGTTGGGGFSR